MIFNIQRFSTHDGSGIRTLIFFKGCPLRCWWCSNPESQSFDYSILYNVKFCKNFGDCIIAETKAISKSPENAIQINRKQIQNPEKLKNVCLSKALTVSGENKSVSEILEEIEKDKLFYREDGGVTISGGEPLSQGDDLTDLLRKLKEKKINTDIETTLHVKWQKIERCIGLTDTFLADLKHTNKEKFKKYTGGDVELVIENFKKLDGSNTKYIVRIPVIPGFNHTEKEMREIIDFVSSLKNAREINFLPYHTFGLEKYKMLDIPCLMESTELVEEKELKPYMRYAESRGIRTKIGG